MGRLRLPVQLQRGVFLSRDSIAICAGIVQIGLIDAALLELYEGADCDSLVDNCLQEFEFTEGNVPVV